MDPAGNVRKLRNVWILGKAETPDVMFTQVNYVWALISTLEVHEDFSWEVWVISRSGMSYSEL
jgi:hypothetical protein